MRRTFALRPATIASLAFATATVSFAYPIPPAPLWRLVHDADAIVVARVIAVDTAPPVERPEGEDDGARMRRRGSIARLLVLDAWKGALGPEVAVAFEPNMICPAPPRYEPGATVLAFLARDPAEDTWVTVSLSYGTMYVAPEDLGVFEARVHEAMALQRAPKVALEDRLEWLVRCAEKSATRWHGLHELSGSPGPSAYEDDSLRIPPAEVLSDAHRARIAAGFLDDPGLDGTLPILLEVLEGYRDERLDAAVVEAIDRELESESPDRFVVHDAIPAILTRMGDKHAERRLDPLGEDWWEEEMDVQTWRRLWAEAKAALAGHGSP